LVSVHEERRHGHVVGLFHCDCGRDKLMVVSDIARGYSKSCGCARHTRSDTKRCPTCKDTFPFTEEFFGHRKHGRRGLDCYCRRCFNEKSRQVNTSERRRLRSEILTHYGRNGRLECCCCGESHEEFLTLDHVNGGGGDDRNRYPATTLFRRLRRLGYPSGYQTLCMNCNFSLGIRGYCPHRRQGAGGPSS
jgi:hypothetical protein